MEQNPELYVYTATPLPPSTTIISPFFVHHPQVFTPHQPCQTTTEDHQGVAGRDRLHTPVEVATHSMFTPHPSCGLHADIRISPSPFWTTSSPPQTALQPRSRSICTPIRSHVRLQSTAQGGVSPAEGS